MLDSMGHCISAPNADRRPPPQMQTPTHKQSFVSFVENVGGTIFPLPGCSAGCHLGSGICRYVQNRRCFLVAEIPSGDSHAMRSLVFLKVMRVSFLDLVTKVALFELATKGPPRPPTHSDLLPSIFLPFPPLLLLLCVCVSIRAARPPMPTSPHVFPSGRCAPVVPPPSHSGFGTQFCCLSSLAIPSIARLKRRAIRFFVCHIESGNSPPPFFFK